MNREAELLDRITALEVRASKLLDRVLELEQEVTWLKARPHQTYPLGGAGSWSFPWGTQVELSKMTGAIGTSVSPEFPKGANGPANVSRETLGD